MINDKTDAGTTPLHHAAHTGNVEVLRALLGHPHVNA